MSISNLVHRKYHLQVVESLEAQVSTLRQQLAEITRQRDIHACNAIEMMRQLASAEADRNQFRDLLDSWTAERDHMLKHKDHYEALRNVEAEKNLIIAELQAERDRLQQQLDASSSRATNWETQWKIADNYSAECDRRINNLQSALTLSQSNCTEAAKLAQEAQAERDKLKQQLAQEEQAKLQLIDERDAAEDAIAKAYSAVTGEAAEWSNLFGYEHALEGIGEALQASQAERDKLREEIAARESAGPYTTWYSGLLRAKRDKLRVALVKLRQDCFEGGEWAKIIDVALAPVHDYLSTACCHGKHAECRKQCKFCGVECFCRCHVKSQAEAEARGLA